MYLVVTMEQHIGKLSKMMVQTISYRDVLTLNDTRKNALKVEIVSKTKIAAPSEAPASPAPTIPAPVRPLQTGGGESKTSSQQPAKFEGTIPTKDSSIKVLRKFIEDNDLNITTAGLGRSKENILKDILKKINN